MASFLHSTMLQFYEDSNYATKSNEKWQKIVYLCFMTHLNFPDSLKVPFCVAQKFKVRPIPWFGLLSFSFWYRHRTLTSRNNPKYFYQCILRAAAIKSRYSRLRNTHRGQCWTVGTIFTFGDSWLFSPTTFGLLFSDIFPKLMSSWAN